MITISMHKFESTSVVKKKKNIAQISRSSSLSKLKDIKKNQYDSLRN